MMRPACNDPASPEALEALDLLAAHLNAPYGHVVTAADLGRALASGFLPDDPQRAALMLPLFSEVDPALIARCCASMGKGLLQANRLYLQTLERGSPRCPAWEQAMETLL